MPQIARQIRPMEEYDLDDVLSIGHGGTRGWGRRDFQKAMRVPGVLCRVIDDCVIGRELTGGDRAIVMVGYLVFGVGARRVDLVQLAVASFARRRGFGRRMIEYVRARLASGPLEAVTRIQAHVTESNLPAQCFLRACDFTAVSLKRGFFEPTDTDEPAVMFQWCKSGPPPAPIDWRSRWRRA